MKARCRSCGVPLECVDTDPLDVDSLEGPVFGFVLECPPGETCGAATTVTFVCCRQLVQVTFPPGSTAAQITALLEDAMERCAVALLFCGGTIVREPPLPPPIPPGPPFPPTPPPPPPDVRMFQSRAQRVNIACENGGGFHYELQAGRFVAPTQEQADARAKAFANALAKIEKFCVNVPVMCACSEVEQMFSAKIIGGTRPFGAAAINGRIPAGMTISVTNQTVWITGTPTTPGLYQFTLAVSDNHGNRWEGPAQIRVLTVGYGVAITLGFTVPAVAATAVTEIPSGRLAVGDTLRFAEVNGAGRNVKELGIFTVTALDTPAPGQTTITNVTATEGDVFPVDTVAFWNLSDVPPVVVFTPYSFQLPATGGSGSYVWTMTGTLPTGIGMSDTGLLSGTPSDDTAVNPIVSFQDLACPIIPSPTNGTIYWGIVSAAQFDPSTFQDWTAGHLTNLITSLQSETGPYRTGGYHMLNPANSTDALGWFIVPDIYADPSTNFGLEWAIGDALVSTDEVLKNAVAQIPNQDLNQVANLYSTENTVNGWIYFKRVFAGVTYRFYVFGEYQSILSEEHTGWATRSRTSNVATLSNPLTPSFLAGSPPSQISGITDSSFNETYVIVTTNGTPAITYPNTGADVPDTANVGGVWSIWSRGPRTWNGVLGASTFTLFVSI